MEKIKRKGKKEVEKGIGKTKSKNHLLKVPLVQLTLGRRSKGKQVFLLPAGQCAW